MKYDLVLIKHALMHYHQRDVTARYEEAFQRINVRRSDLFVCAFSKPTFDVRKSTLLDIVLLSTMVVLRENSFLH